MGAGAAAADALGGSALCGFYSSRRRRDGRRLSAPAFARHSAPAPGAARCSRAAPPAAARPGGRRRPAAAARCRRPVLLHPDGDLRAVQLRRRPPLGRHGAADGVDDAAGQRRLRRLVAGLPAGGLHPEGRFAASAIPFVVAARQYSAAAATTVAAAATAPPRCRRGGAGAEFSLSWNKCRTIALRRVGESIAVALLDTSIFAPAATPLTRPPRHPVAAGKEGAGAGRFAARAEEQQGFSSGRFDFAQLFIIPENFVKNMKYGCHKLPSRP
jgi:hypothetical protein